MRIYIWSLNTHTQIRYSMISLLHNIHCHLRVWFVIESSWIRISPQYLLRENTGISHESQWCEQASDDTKTVDYTPAHGPLSYLQTSALSIFSPVTYWKTDSRRGQRASFPPWTAQHFPPEARGPAEQSPWLSRESFLTSAMFFWFCFLFFWDRVLLYSPSSLKNWK